MAGLGDLGTWIHQTGLVSCLAGDQVGLRCHEGHPIFGVQSKCGQGRVVTKPTSKSPSIRWGESVPQLGPPPLWRRGQTHSSSLAVNRNEQNLYESTQATANTGIHNAEQISQAVSSF